MANAPSRSRAAMPGGRDGTILGTNLGGYHVIARLGVAGPEALYLARHVALNREAVVEVVRGGPGGAARGERFLEAARALARVAHPGLVEVLDCGFTVDAAPYLVRERLDGESVAARVEREGFFDEEEAARLVAQAASALAAAHARGVTHGALTAERIVLVGDPERPGRDRAKVVGFGSEGRDASRTAARDDVSALGMVLAAMVSMRPPAAGPPPRPEPARGRRLTVPRPAARSRPAPASPALMAVLRRMLDPTGDGASMEEVRRLLSGPPGPIAPRSGARIDPFLGPSGKTRRSCDSAPRFDSTAPDDSAPTTKMDAVAATSIPTLYQRRVRPMTIELPTTKMAQRPVSLVPSGVPPLAGALEGELRRPRFWIAVVLVTVAAAALFLALASVAVRLVT